MRTQVEPERMRVEAHSQKPGSLSQAIRAGLRSLGDADAPADAVRRAVIDLFPDLKERVESEKHWNAYVTQNRDKAAEEMGMARRKRLREERLEAVRRQEQPQTLTYADYQAGREFVDGMFGGDTDKAERLLQVLEGRDINELKAAIQGWLGLVESAGSSERAQRVLETMKGSGAIL